MAVILSAIATPARADTTASFQVSATIEWGCEINGDLATGGETLGQYGTVDFGTHSALSTDVVTAAIAKDLTLVISCTPGVSLNMMLGAGLHATAGRNMQGTTSGALQPYELYRDAALTEQLVANQSFPVSFSDPEAISLPIFGRVSLNGTQPPDTYSDTIQLTLSW